jgi:hypothetical protein
VALVTQCGELLGRGAVVSVQGEEQVVGLALYIVGRQSDEDVVVFADSVGEEHVLLPGAFPVPAFAAGDQDQEK